MKGDNLEFVQAIAAAFKEMDFPALRDALEEADRLEELAALGPFGELMLEAIDPSVEVDLHGIRGAMMVGRDLHGWKGWLEFWRSWLEPWEAYTVEYSRWEVVGDTVLLRLDVEARGRGSGVEVRDHITQAWTVEDGRVTRLRMYASRRSALADLGRG